jgi:hypothetical protein
MPIRHQTLTRMVVWFVLWLRDVAWVLRDAIGGRSWGCFSVTNRD